MAAPIVNFEPSPLEGDESIRRALEINPDSSLVLDPSGTVRMANLPAIRHLRPSQGNLVGAHWLSLFAEADRQAAGQALEAAAAGEARRFRASVPGPGGGRTWDSTVAPLRDAAGFPFGLIAVAKDVTDLEELRRTAEEQVRGVTYRFEILRAAADGVGLVGLEIDFVRGVVTGGVDSNLPERHPSPRLGQFSIESVLEIYHVEDRPRVRAQIERTRVFGEPLRFDARFVREDGGLGWVRVIGEPVYEDGTCIAIRGAGMDITEEVAAQEDVLRAQKRLSLATRLAGMEVYELDFNRQILIHEGSGQALLDPSLRYEDLWPDPIRLVDPQDRARIEAAWSQSQESQSTFSAEFRLRRQEGEDQAVWVYAVAELLQDDGRPQRLVGAVLDISERKRAELRILETMAKMREHEARQKLLLDELNHRVKNTLAAVQSIAVQTLTDGRPPLEGRDLFIDRLLALSSTHNLLVKHAWRSASLQELMEATLEPYGQVYGRDGPDLLFNPNFAVSVGMALHELATNALKHGAWSAGGGRISVSTDVHGQDVVITWREHGGPRVVAPTKRGFGSRLLLRGVAGELGGKVALDFAPDGLVCRIQASISPRLRVVGPNHGN